MEKWSAFSAFHIFSICNSCCRSPINQFSSSGIKRRPDDDIMWLLFYCLKKGNMLCLRELWVAVTHCIVTPPENKHSDRRQMNGDNWREEMHGGNISSSQCQYYSNSRHILRQWSYYNMTLIGSYTFLWRHYFNIFYLHLNFSLCGNSFEDTRCFTLFILTFNGNVLF